MGNCSVVFKVASKKCIPKIFYSVEEGMFGYNVDVVFNIECSNSSCDKTCFNLAPTYSTTTFVCITHNDVSRKKWRALQDVCGEIENPIKRQKCVDNLLDHEDVVSNSCPSDSFLEMRMFSSGLGDELCKCLEEKPSNYSSPSLKFKLDNFMKHSTETRVKKRIASR